MSALTWCPACGDDYPCEFGTCGDPDCLSRDCESHDACEPPDLRRLVEVLAGPPWVTVTPSARCL